ncbi:hypothetical protein PNOK_0558500 [Pyrrhoderma noxium]|uniref:Uncharacterized protein n=1 Tax=Pyrrhoderma noxium TaxID=2282107 RepID=A0A286UGJ2_9AGAM|nr:hypothetical protein PNOK_0558500 [Pyrrhoderma noxium]
MGIHFPNESFGLLLSFHPPSKDQGDAGPPFPAKNTALAPTPFISGSASSATSRPSLPPQTCKLERIIEYRSQF